MINLLAANKKAEIRAARTNVILLRYIGIILVGLAFILGALYVTYTILTLTKNSSDQVIASNDLKAGVYSSTKTQVDALSASLAQTKLILDKEVRYSKVLVNLAQLMPAGTVFDKLTLDSSSFTGTPIATKIYAKTSADAAVLHQQFQQSPLFSNIVFQPAVESGSGIEGYPVSVDVTFTFAKGVTQ
jgi:hypothetical protein